MTMAVAASLAGIGLTFAFFVTVNVKSLVANRRRLDALGAIWSLVMAVWFGYAATWVLLHTH